MNLINSNWITCSFKGDVCPVFRRSFRVDKELRYAELEITALGVYEAELNGKRVGQFVLAPGWTSYQKRLQVQRYDVTDLLDADNELCVTVGKGWFRSPMPGWEESEDKTRRASQPCGLIAALLLSYADGSEEIIRTDGSWQTAESAIRFSEIYDGESCDGRFEPTAWESAKLLDWPKEILIEQEGAEIREIERIPANRVFKTPAGETVVDFGQEVTGYAEIALEAQAGDRVRFTHGEVLDAGGNFYNANYRSAKAIADYVCREGFQIWHPKLTFFGFRYLKLLEYPGEANAENFTAIVVHSELHRTGWIESGDAQFNQLLSNIVWSQRDNFLDVPTDCPQRDERLGWTGDAQVFAKAASLNYDVEQFFRKWLRDLAADQRESGEVGEVIPDVMPYAPGSAAWGDAAVICPWRIYQTYGDTAVLEEQFDSMKAWVDFISSATTAPDLWTGHFHFGDWLGLDAPAGSYKGSSREDLIATAFYAYSTKLLIKTGSLLGKDMSAYEAQLARTVAAFRKIFPTYLTQTEHVLAVHFGLTENPQYTADALAAMIEADGCRLRTGFVGTPYLLHALSDYGHSDLAWKLLLRQEYPGWLYSVRKGATTVWEHWDGLRDDGSFWSTDMNSFNHYSYGAVIDWIYEKAAGLAHDEDAPGYSHLRFEPHPNKALGWLSAELETRSGIIRSRWEYEGSQVRIELETPVAATASLPSGIKELSPGKYIFRERYE